MWNLPVGESWQVATPPPGKGRPKGDWLISAQVSNQPELRTSLMWPREPGSPSMPQRWHQILLGSASGISNTNEGLQTVSTPHPQPWTLALMALIPVPWVFGGELWEPCKEEFHQSLSCSCCFPAYGLSQSCLHVLCNPGVLSGNIKLW